jgi:hypothetical protein
LSFRADARNLFPSTYFKMLKLHYDRGLSAHKSYYIKSDQGETHVHSN